MNGSNANSNGDTKATTFFQCDNYINGVYVTTKEYMNVINPSNDSLIGQVGISDTEDVEQAVQAASAAYKTWSAMTIKARALLLLKLHALLVEKSQEIASLIVLENGKNIHEALAEVAKGNETLEYSLSLPQLTQGKKLQVSSGDIYCEDYYQSLGVVTSIVPFNFPFMVPMWTIPIAIMMGNTMILKPSEKVPITMNRVVQYMKQVGIPDGVVNIINGTKSCVEALIHHPTIQAVTFVGSSTIAKVVADLCHTIGNHKRCTALGGAKNHLVAITSDCHIESTASDIVVSFAGCAGQRCMAASVLLLVSTNHPNEIDDNTNDYFSVDYSNCSDGDTLHHQTGKNKNQLLLAQIVQQAAKIQPGNESGQMGPVIDHLSYQRILQYIDAAVQDGATILLDGRIWKEQYHTDIIAQNGGNNWIGPTILLHRNSTDVTMREEVFGPVLSIYVCSSWQEAITIENNNPYGNAASIYTTIGAHAQWFLSKFRASMLGCNIGIPVPREPFSFGGLYGTKSKYGQMDITGDGAIEFFSNRIKITSKWPAVALSNPITTTSTNGHKSTTPSDAPNNEQKDIASFAGSM